MLQALSQAWLARKGVVDGVEGGLDGAGKIMGCWWNGEYQDLALSNFYTLA